MTRAKKNSRFQRRYSRPVDKSTGLRFDQTVVLTGFRSQQQYPDALRRIGFRDLQTGQRLVFLRSEVGGRRTVIRTHRGRRAVVRGRSSQRP